MVKLFRILLMLAIFSLILSACSETEETSPTALLYDADPLTGVKGIVDPGNHGWPRIVEVLNGRITIPAKPQRILTVSLGHDEVTYALVPQERVVAVGEFTRREDSSNVAHLARDLPVVTRDPERIASFKPDIVIASAFSRPELIASLENAGIVVAQTELNNHFEGRVNDIMLMGYMYGEEERAAEFVAEIRKRHKDLTGFTMSKAVKPRVVSLTSYSGKIYTAGKNSTEGEIIETAGAINVAAEAGLEHNPVISLESVISMNPDYIFVPQPEPSASEFMLELRTNKVLADVPAVKDNRIYFAAPKFFTTLSFWNLRGAEEAAKIIWPELKDKQYQEFSFPK